ncbi:unnamed protein product [Prunus armeniaca]
MWHRGGVKYSSIFPTTFGHPIVSWVPSWSRHLTSTWNWAPNWNRLVTSCWSRIPNYYKCKASLCSSSYCKLVFPYFLACEGDLGGLYCLSRRGVVRHTKLIVAMMWRLKRATMVAVVACSVGGCCCNHFLFYWSLALLVVVATAFFFAVQWLGRV